jgi:hypothetical protein
LLAGFFFIRCLNDLVCPWTRKEIQQASPLFVATSRSFEAEAFQHMSYECRMSLIKRSQLAAIVNKLLPNAHARVHFVDGSVS